MPRYTIEHADAYIGRYEAADASEALLKFLTDSYRASIRHKLVTTPDGCKATAEIDGETLVATLDEDDDD